MNKIKLNEVSVGELVDLERACSLICKNYENATKMYDGSINTNIKEYSDFNYFNNIRRNLIKEIEIRLKNIEL